MSRNLYGYNFGLIKTTEIQICAKNSWRQTVKGENYFVTSSLRVWVVAKSLDRKVILEVTFLQSSCEHSI
jgi:hypothetical protein